MINSSWSNMSNTSKSSDFFYVFVLLSFLLMLVSQWMIWSYSPEELTLGRVQRMFYLHLPLAWWALVAFFIVFLSSIGFLWKNKDVYHFIAVSAAEVGVLFSTLVLLTGILWAKASWNTWWTWDPRLSTTLIMWFVYLGYLILASSMMPEHRRKTICAVLGVVAFLDVPLVFLSARLWRTIHPSVFAEQGGLPREMLFTVVVALLAWGLVFGLIFALRKRQLSFQSRVDRLLYSDNY